MRRKERTDKNVRGWPKIMVEIGIPDHNDFCTYPIAVENLLDPAPHTVSVAGPAQHIKNSVFIL